MARTISRRWLDSLKLRCRLIVEREKWEAPEADPQMLFLHLLYAIKIGITIIIIIALLSLFYLTVLSSLFFYLSATTHTHIIYLLRSCIICKRKAAMFFFCCCFVSNNLSISVVSFLNILISYLCVEVNLLSMSSCFLFYDILKRSFLFLCIHMCNNVMWVNFLIWEAFFHQKKNMKTAVRFSWWFFYKINFRSISFKRLIRELSEKCATCVLKIN